MRKLKLLGLAFVLLAGLAMTGCGFLKKEEETRQNLDFTVVSEERLPEALKEILLEKKEAPFKLTYMDEGYLYLCIGYGKKDTGGYSITVNELYMTDNAVYVDTNLIGPQKSQEKGRQEAGGERDSASYPYIVIKTEYRDKTVVFN